MTDEIPAPRPPEPVVVTFEACGHGHPTRRYTFERLEDKPDSAEWLRTEETHAADGWRFVGSQPVESLTVEVGDSVVVDL